VNQLHVRQVSMAILAKMEELFKEHKNSMTVPAFVR